MGWEEEKESKNRVCTDRALRGSPNYFFFLFSAVICFKHYPEIWSVKAAVLISVLQNLVRF